jgi:hypothetical protein
MRYREKTNVCIDLLDPNEETFKRALDFITAGEMIRCVTVVNGQEKERAVIFQYTPRDHPYTSEEYHAWLAAKRLAGGVEKPNCKCKSNQACMECSHLK